MLNEEHACARCGRETPDDALILWTSRERLREYSRRGQKAATLPGAFKGAVRSPRVLQGAGGVLQAHSAAPPAETKAAQNAEMTAPITAAAAARQSAASASNAQPGGGGRAVQYRWVTVAHAVCPDCHAVIARDAGRFHDHDRRRAVIIALSVLALAALIWVGYVMFLPSWAAAFWQNGARGP